MWGNGKESPLSPSEYSSPLIKSEGYHGRCAQDGWGKPDCFSSNRDLRLQDYWIRLGGSWEGGDPEYGRPKR